MLSSEVAQSLKSYALWTFSGPWGRDRSQSPHCWIFRVKQIHLTTASKRTTRQMDLKLGISTHDLGKNGADIEVWTEKKGLCWRQQTNNSSKLTILHHCNILNIYHM